jgi:hypothetical protein
MYILCEVFEDYLHNSVPHYTTNMHCLLIHNYNNFSNEIAPFHISAGISKHVPNLHN